MKKLLLLLSVIWFSALPVGMAAPDRSTPAAPGQAGQEEPARPDYPQKLYGDDRYPLLYAHMGMARYLDLDSFAVRHWDSDALIFSETTLTVAFDRQYRISKAPSPAEVWYFLPLDPTVHCCTGVSIDGREVILPPYVGEDIAFSSYDAGKSWMPFYISDTHGYNLSTRTAFLHGLTLAKGSRKNAGSTL